MMVLEVLHDMSSNKSKRKIFRKYDNGQIILGTIKWISFILINYGGLFVLLLVLGLVVLSINASFDRAHLAFFSALLIFSFVSYPFRYPITWVALAWYTASLDYKFSKTIYIPMPIAIVTFLFSGVFICLYTVKNVKLHIRWASAYNNSLLGRYEKAEKNIAIYLKNYIIFLNLFIIMLLF